MLGGRTVNDALVVPLSPWASWMLIGSDFAPTLVLLATVAVNEKLLLPLSVNDCVAEPPMAVRSPSTVMPLLAGPVPGVTVTVMVVVAPGKRLLGLAEATPVGGVDDEVTVSAIDVVPVRFCASAIALSEIKLRKLSFSYDPTDCIGAQDQIPQARR